MPHSGSGALKCAGILRTTNTGEFIEGNLSTQRYCHNVVPFTCHDRLMFQNDNAQLHVARICAQFLFLNSSVLACYSAFYHFFLNLHYLSLRRSGSALYMVQSTHCEGNVLQSMNQIVPKSLSLRFADNVVLLALSNSDWQLAQG